MTGLLVSVRDAEEARTALEQGAALIDVKEPARGPLGRADATVIESVVQLASGRCPVSAALGELANDAGGPIPSGLAFVKWGLAWPWEHGWRERLLQAAREAPCAVAACAYADLGASGPTPEEVGRLAVGHRLPALLLDTFQKDGRTLLDHVSLDRLSALAESCRRGGVQLALAGSLTLDAIRAVLPLGPRWVAVRGAACEGGREGRICARRVRELARLVHGEGVA
jgi:uncharacterized protein (UPF0264 family)